MVKKTESDKTLEQVLADIEKQFGKGSVMKLGEEKHTEIQNNISERKKHLVFLQSAF